MSSQINAISMLFVIGAVVFIVAAASAFENTCKMLITECPVFRIKTNDKHNGCIIDYLYAVNTEIYNGSLYLKDDCRDYTTFDYVAVCFDTSRPWKHQVSLSSSNLDPGIYIMDIIGIWIGVGLMVPCLVHVVLGMFVTNQGSRGSQDNIELNNMKRSDSATSI